jgi:hypothetical protein
MKPYIIDGECSHGAVLPGPMQFAKRLDTARWLQNLLPEFRRCINTCDRLISKHENNGTSSANRNDVSRIGKSRREF